MKEFESFMNYQKQIAQQEFLANLLDWDLKVNCPKNGKDYLIDVKSEIDRNIFELKTSNEYNVLLTQYIESEEFQKLSEIEKRYLKILKEDYDINKKVPVDFYQEYMTLCTKATTVWEDAKKENNYELFKPYLEKLITMTKDYYHYQYPDMDIYDAMLNSYEKGMTTKEIDPLFEQIKNCLIPLVHQVKSKVSSNHFRYPYSDSELKNCANVLLDYIGFDTSRGTTGIYPHGFTTKIQADDIRIAFQSTDNPYSFVSTIIHEGGHGIFEQNINSNISTISNNFPCFIYGLHESQSRFFENILGRNENFWTPIYPKIKELLHLPMTQQEFVEELNHVSLGPIRTEADELTYCLHIIIRYELERDIFKNNLKVEDLPHLWNEKIKEYLGIDVQNDAEGILQDVHWSQGNFGYFPSYLLGNIYDGMFLEQMGKDLGNIDLLLEQGKIKEITNYLIERVHHYGNTIPAKDLIEQLCNQPINANAIIRYFENKYRK